MSENEGMVCFDIEKWTEEEEHLIKYCNIQNNNSLTMMGVTNTSERDIVCIMPFIFTHAIIADMNESGYSKRWCYKTLDEAVNALVNWKVGEEEPKCYTRRLIGS